MTSKEALNRLSEYIGELGGGETLEEEDVILEDLEILEFIKSYYKINDYNELVPKYLVITKCDYVGKFIKLKEWLENDNNIKK